MVLLGLGTSMTSPCSVRIASSAEAEKVGFELNVGDGPVVLGVVTLDGMPAALLESLTAPSAEEASALPSTNSACISVLDMDADWVVTFIGLFIVEEL